MNVLLFTADDMNGDTPGCFGGPAEVTPTVDALAADGMRFTRAHVNVAICQPSRSVMATGRYPHRNGAEGFGPIRPEVPVVTDLLHEGGYRCGILGKVEHLEPIERFRWDHAVDQPGLGYGRDPARYADETRRFLADAAGSRWFLMCNAHDPHRPFTGSAQEANQWGDEAALIPKPSHTFDPATVSAPGFLPDLADVRAETAQYLSSCRRADDVLAAVLAEVEAAGHYEDTLVIFLSDNGMSFPYAKSNCYLHSTRTPLVVRWPGVTTPGSVDEEHFVEGIDLLPTIADALNLPGAGACDGTTFVPLLRGHSQGGRERVVTVFHETVYGRRYEMRAVQDRSTGYIWNAWSDGDEAYLADNMMGLTWSAMWSAAADDETLAKRCAHYLHRCPEELYDFGRDPDALHNRVAEPNAWLDLETKREQLRTWMSATDDPLAESFDAHLDALNERLDGTGA